MLPLTPFKEAKVSQQRSLFEVGTAPWVVRLWEAIVPEKRQEVLALLAEMARDALVGVKPIRRKDTTNEP